VSTYALAVSLVLCIAAAVLEGVLAGTGVKQRFAELRQPPLSPPLGMWVVIGVLYYAICFAVLYRILSLGLHSALALIAFALLLALMLANAVWNYVFFRRKNLRGSLMYFYAYGALTLALTSVLVSVDRLAAALLLPYLAYLAYATWWGYRLWRLNEHTAG
jgi:tryptophan-rich sensory protein